MAAAAPCHVRSKNCCSILRDFPFFFFFWFEFSSLNGEVITTRVLYGSRSDLQLVAGWWIGLSSSAWPLCQGAFGRFWEVFRSFFRLQSALRFHGVCVVLYCPPGITHHPAIPPVRKLKEEIQTTAGVSLRWETHSTNCSETPRRFFPRGALGELNLGGRKAPTACGHSTSERISFFIF